MVLPFGWSLFYRGSLKARRKEGPRGVAFELNRSFKISWSIELDGGKEFWKMDLSEKAINLGQGMSTKKPEHLQNFRISDWVEGAREGL